MCLVSLCPAHLIRQQWICDCVCADMKSKIFVYENSESELSIKDRVIDAL